MDNLATVSKMILHIEKIQEYIKDLDYESFSKNEMIVEACAFNFSQIGELSHRLEDGFQKSNPLIPWKAIYGMRNKIIHDCFFYANKCRGQLGKGCRCKHGRDWRGGVAVAERSGVMEREGTRGTPESPQKWPPCHF
ncbi:MAG: DUF86 domain-containing protein [Treponema sp.]|nr:DUF86 domain-containing protein [Treponema sp.]